MENLDIDPFFKEEGGVLGSRGADDPRYFLMPEESFMNRYHFAMSNHGLAYNSDGTPNKYKYWSNDPKSVPKCDSCKGPIVDSSDLRKQYGILYHGDCFSHVIADGWKGRDKRLVLQRQEAYFLRVAGLLNNPAVVNPKKVATLVSRARKEYKRILRYNTQEIKE